MDGTLGSSHIRGITAIVLGASLVIATAGQVLAGDARALRVPVLMYHRFSSAPADARLPGLWVSPARFRAQLAALKAAGWRSITAERLALALQDGRRVGRRRFVITLDDGARDGYRNAAPVLADLGMVATYCVTPGRAGRRWQLGFRHMRTLRDAGHEIANHSLTHADLTAVRGPELRRQVVGAHRLITERVGHAPRTLCYPYGRHDQAARRVVGRAGYLLAFTTASGALHTRRASLRSPRIRVNGWDSPAQLVARLEPFARAGASTTGATRTPRRASPAGVAVSVR
jgi:peptidoglycan/xylan/chitin deacetylase (PgdA/CDA1 family)